jgi:hypothetical protein
MGSRYYEEYLDDQYRWTPAALKAWRLERAITENYEECQDLMLQAISAVNIPRRTGADATGAELALDKKLLRKIVYDCHMTIRDWLRLADRSGDLAGALSQKPNTDQKAKGASLNIRELAGERVDILINLRGNLVAACVQTNQQSQANKIAHLLTASIERWRGILAMAEGRED